MAIHVYRLHLSAQAFPLATTPGQIVKAAEDRLNRSLAGCFSKISPPREDGSLLLLCDEQAARLLQDCGDPVIGSVVYEPLLTENRRRAGFDASL